MMLRCPICFGEIVDIKIDVYEDEDVKKIIITGRCSRCGAPYKYEKVINKARIERKYIPWRPEARLGVAP
jgi:C4-type Zn-finger protein